MSMAEELILNLIPKESLLQMPYYIPDSEVSNEWHQPGRFETRRSFSCVEFKVKDSLTMKPDLQFYFRKNEKVILLNGKPIEFYKLNINKSKIRKR